jgi:cytochrome b
VTITSDKERAHLSGARVVAWDGPTRVFKWLLVLLVFDGWLSNSFGAGFPGWHKWNGYAVLVLIVFRLLWGFAGGSTSRFSAFVAGPAATFAYVRAQIAGRPLKYLGHNPLGAWMIVALLAAVTAQGLTGLYAADQDRLIIEGPLAKTVADAAVDFAARWHHRIFDAIEILAVLHIAANVFYTFIKREPLIEAMVTGRKPEDDFVDMTTANPGSWARAALCLFAAATLVFGAIALAGGSVLSLTF